MFKIGSRVRIRDIDLTATVVGPCTIQKPNCWEIQIDDEDPVCGDRIWDEPERNLILIEEKE